MTSNGKLNTLLRLGLALFIVLAVLSSSVPYLSLLLNDTTLTFVLVEEIENETEKEEEQEEQEKKHKINASYSMRVFPFHDISELNCLLRRGDSNYLPDVVLPPPESLSLS